MREGFTLGSRYPASNWQGWDLFSALATFIGFSPPYSTFYSFLHLQSSFVTLGCHQIPPVLLFISHFSWKNLKGHSGRKGGLESHNLVSPQATSAYSCTNSLSSDFFLKDGMFLHRVLVRIERVRHVKCAAHSKNSSQWGCTFPFLWIGSNHITCLGHWNVDRHDVWAILGGGGGALEPIYNLSHLLLPSAWWSQPSKEWAAPSAWLAEGGIPSWLRPCGIKCKINMFCYFSMAWPILTDTAKAQWRWSYQYHLLCFTHFPKLTRDGHIS